jgi:hypothetical protein
MTIIDQNGKVITIENLELAIMQADDYRHYKHVDPSFKLLDEGLQVYWEDVYQKLLEARSE